MKCNARGIALIKRHEGLRLRAYRDTGGVWTIGYGHTGDVHEGDRITAHQAEAIFDVDLDKFERGVERLLKGFPVTENEFSALVSFAFNVGLDEDHDGKAEGLGDSALLRKLLAGDRTGAAGEFRKWCHVHGEVLQELVDRRKDERELFLSPVAQEAA